MRNLLTAARFGQLRQALPCRFWDNFRARLSWDSAEVDLDLLVREPDGQEYACFATGPVSPGGLFSCDAPANELLFEQYTWRPFPSPGAYCFAAAYLAGAGPGDALFEILDLEGTPVFSAPISISPGQILSITCVTQCRRPGDAEQTALDCALAQAPDITDPDEYLQFVTDLLAGIAGALATIPDASSLAAAQSFCSAIAEAPFIEEPAVFIAFAVSLLERVVLAFSGPPAPGSQTDA